MVAFCKNVVNEIRSAGSKEELSKLISSSITSYKEKSPADVGKYILNMIVYLHATKREHSISSTESNLEFAIQIFRELRKQYPDHTF